MQTHNFTQKAPRPVSLHSIAHTPAGYKSKPAYAKIIRQDNQNRQRMTITFTLLPDSF
ncbi:MAG: hypothetical protein R6X34_16575 [Chloroflexota bacterium]